MNVVFLDKFGKDLDNVRDTKVQTRIAAVIEEIERADTLSAIKNLKKMKGYAVSYRIRIGNYRLGIYFENDTVELARIVHRKDIYKYFPDE
jgi:mRNA-degrading endonuclease RelE of RelBE toxin-antitoxin system